MSQPNDLINDPERVFAYIDSVIEQYPYVLDAAIIGSRGCEMYRLDSDWDVHLVTRFPVQRMGAVAGRIEGYNIDFVTSTEWPKSQKSWLRLEDAKKKDWSKPGKEVHRNAYYKQR